MMTYYDYLLSEKWQARRQSALEYSWHRCQVCNSPDNLEVHHRTYERLGCEDPADLTVLCRLCHALFYRRMNRSPYYWLQSLGYNIEVPVYE